MNGPGQTILSDWGSETTEDDELPPWQSPVVLKQLCYEEELSPMAISDRLGCSESAVFYWTDKYGIERPDLLPDATTNPASYCITNRGYEEAVSMTEDGVRSMYIHRLVAIAEYGAEAVKDKIVHHRNGIPWDNRPENLKLMTQSEHATVHAGDIDESKAKWRDPHTLHNLYIEEGMTLTEVGDELGCSGPTVHSWMVEHEIGRRPPITERHQSDS